MWEIEVASREMAGESCKAFLTQRPLRARRWRGKWEIALRLIKRGVSGFWDLMGLDEIINESDLALNEGRIVRKFEGFM